MDMSLPLLAIKHSQIALLIRTIGQQSQASGVGPLAKLQVKSLFSGFAVDIQALHGGLEPMPQIEWIGRVGIQVD